MSSGGQSSSRKYEFDWEFAQDWKFTSGYVLSPWKPLKAELGTILIVRVSDQPIDTGPISGESEPEPVPAG